MILTSAMAYSRRDQAKAGKGRGEGNSTLGWGWGEWGPG